MARLVRALAALSVVVFLGARTPTPDLDILLTPNTKLCTPAHVVPWNNPQTNCDSTCVATPSCTAGIGSDTVVKGECGGTGPGCTVPCGQASLTKNTYQCIETSLGCTGSEKRCVWNLILSLPQSIEDCCGPAPPG